MIYTNMLFALALDKVVFGQSPGWWSLGGSGLILGSAVFVAVKKGQGQEEGIGGRERDEEVGAGGEEQMSMLGGGADLDEDDVEEAGGVDVREAAAVGREDVEAEVELREFSSAG